MTVKIGSNTASINAQRRLGEATATLSDIYAKLSSGLRINKASDDAAGLAIADELNAKSKVYTQAIRNGNDGISLLNIADSAVSNLTAVVTRIRELSEQAANGSYSSKQRAALDAEAQALSKEFTRISQTTTFNGIKIFDGSLGSGLNLQLGYGNNESINASIGGAIGTAAFGDLTQYSTEGSYSNSIKFGDLNGDGVLDLVTAGYDSSSGKVTVRLGLGNGQFGSASTYTSDGIRSNSMQLADLNSDGNLDIISAGSGAGGGKMTILLGSGNGTFDAAVSYTTELNYSNNITVGDINNDGIVDAITTGLGASGGSSTVRLGIGDGTFSTAVSYTAELNNSFNLTLGDVNNDGNLDLTTLGYDSGSGKISIRLGTGSGTFGSALSITTYGIENIKLADFNNDGNLDFVTVGNYAGGKATLALGRGDGNFNSINTFTTDANVSYGVQTGDFNGDGNTDLLTAGGNGTDGTITLQLGNGSGGFSGTTTYTTEALESYNLFVGDLNSDGVLDFGTAGNAGGSGQASIRLSSTKQGLGSLLDFSLKTRSGALQSMTILDNALSNLAKQHAQIGTSQSRVNIALNNLTTATENFRSAESRIRDADIAAESAALVRTQILQQAATAVLSQANQAPALALKLLNSSL